MLIELIEGGYLAQLLLVIAIWGVIAFLAATHAEIPDPLLDAGFLILGFYFHSALQVVKGRFTSDKVEKPPSEG